MIVLEPDQYTAITSKCSKLIDVCCRDPNFTLPPTCGTDSDVGGSDEDIDDRLFGPDGDDDDIFKDENDDDDIFGPDLGIFSRGNCGKRNKDGLTNTLDEVAEFYFKKY